MKTEVDCIVYNDKNKEMLDKHLLKYIKDNKYSYVSVFVDGVDLFSSNEKHTRALDCKNINEMLEKRYMCGFKFDVNTVPDLLKEDIVEYIKDNYKFFPEVYPIKSWALLPKTNSPMFIDFSTPFFLGEQLKAKHLIILDDTCETFKTKVEEAILNEIKNSLYNWMINCPVDGIKERLTKAKSGALMREELDRREINWRAFPKEAESGIYHDEIIDQVTEMFEGEQKTFYKMGEESEVSPDVDNFVKAQLQSMTFNKACKYFYRNISWKDYYKGTLDGTETDLFYVNKEPFVKFKDIKGGKREYYKYYGDPSLQFVLTPYDIVKEGNEDNRRNKKISLEYLKYNEGIDPEIIDYLSDFYGIKLDKKKFDIKPAPLYINDYSEVSDRQINKKDTDRYKWEESHKNIQSQYENAIDKFFILD